MPLPLRPGRPPFGTFALSGARYKVAHIRERLVAGSPNSAASTGAPGEVPEPAPQSAPHGHNNRGTKSGRQPEGSPPPRAELNTPLTRNILYS